MLLDGSSIPNATAVDLALNAMKHVANEVEFRSNCSAIADLAPTRRRHRLSLIAATRTREDEDWNVVHRLLPAQP